MVNSLMQIAFVLLFVSFSQLSQSLRIVDVFKSSEIASGKPYPYSMQLLTSGEKNERKPVMFLPDDGKAIPFTNEKSPFSNERHSSDDEEEEEGVGPAVSVDYSPAVPLEDAESAENDTSEDLKIQVSDIHPVYVKPPTDFKPVIFPNRKVDGVEQGSKVDSAATIAPPVKPYPYHYPNGLSSWLTGGIRGLQRGGFWERLASDESLNGYKPDRMPIDIFSLLMRPLTQIYPQEAVIPPSLSAYRPPLPPYRKMQSHHSRHQLGSGSWMFGSAKQTPQNWEIPSVVIEKIEVVPLSHKSSHRSQHSTSPNYKVTHNFLDDLMTGDGDEMTDDRVHEPKRNQYRPVIAATLLFESEPEHYNLVNVD